MAKTVPLIRASSMVSLMHWMRNNGRPLEKMLAAVDLDYVQIDKPMQPVPLLNVGAFYREAGRLEGPDIGCRAVRETGISELALLGEVALSSRSPREALTRVATILPYHCSNEHFQTRSEGDEFLFIDGWSVLFDDETLHIVQQFVATLVGLLCSFAEPKHPPLSRVAIMPHPEHGLAHLAPWFGRPVEAAQDRALTLHIPASIADQPFRHNTRERFRQPVAQGLKPLNGYVSLAESCYPVVSAMLETGIPTAERLARASGMSLRSLQRRLKAEGSSFSMLLEEARREIALTRIAQRATSLGAVSATLGFARQSALTRAVRRWTGQAPSGLRKMEKS